MSELLEVLKDLMLLIMIIIILAGLLFVMLISAVYIFGYIYDSIFGNSIVMLGHLLGRKHPKIKNNTLVVKIWKIIQKKELYLRYETPLFTYCFSYIAIFMLSRILPNKNDMSFIVASVLYLLFYFIGMARKCRSNEQYYNKVLNHNMEFLKLSFLPLGFIITVVGFCFTITGKKIQDLPFDFMTIVNTFTSLMNYSDETNMLMLPLKILVLGGGCLY